MKHAERISLGLLVAAMAMGSVGCSLEARTPDMYRKATRDVLETRTSDIKACYDGLLKSDKNTSGSVVISFKVAPETGVIGNVKVSGGSAGTGLQDCVSNALSGLKIDPPDANEGIATFTYEFDVAPQKPAPKASGFKADS